MGHHFDLYQTLVVTAPAGPGGSSARFQVGTLAAASAGAGGPTSRLCLLRIWEALNRRYDEWIGSFTLCPVLTVETDNLNYVSDSAVWRR
ncbi:MAG: hypothetical protein R2851_07245 [Caldilineaceae bacterium]